LIKLSVKYSMGNGQSQTQGNKHTITSMQAARRNARQQVLLKQKSVSDVVAMSNVVDPNSDSATSDSSAQLGQSGATRVERSGKSAVVARSAPVGKAVPKPAHAPATASPMREMIKTSSSF
jgi:hypothetical protein